MFGFALLLGLYGAFRGRTWARAVLFLPRETYFESAQYFHDLTFVLQIPD